MTTDPNPHPTRQLRRTEPASTGARRRRPVGPPGRRRIGAGLAVLACVGSAFVLGGPLPTAGADTPYLPQDVGFSHTIQGCELGVAASDEIAFGAEVHLRIAGASAFAYEETYVIPEGGDGLFAETLAYGDEFLVDAFSTQVALDLELTYEGTLIDEYHVDDIAAAFAPLCADDVNADALMVGLRVEGDVPAGAHLEAELRAGECGNAQEPAATLGDGELEATHSTWVQTSVFCLNPVETFGATVTYTTGSPQLLVPPEGLAVGITWDFTELTDPDDDPADDPDATTTTSTTPPTSPTTSTTTPADAAAVLAVELVPAAATPVVVSPSFTG